MKSSYAALQLIRASEAFRPKPYLCPAGVPTIGFGSTRYEDGAPVKLGDPEITEDRANALIFATLGTEYEPAVNRYVKVPLKQNQFDALVDFSYNAGTQALRTSTLLRLLNAGDYGGAAGQFCRWVFADGVKLNGLVTRRAAEELLFRGLL